MKVNDVYINIIVGLNNGHTANVVHNAHVTGLDPIRDLLKTNQEKIPKVFYANIVRNNLQAHN